MYLVFHLLVKLPLISLLPSGLARRLIPSDGGAQHLPTVPWFAVPTSLLLGALTHLGWDAFTHEEAPAVRAFEILRVQLFSVGSYRVFAYKILQHGSTLIGVLILGWWIVQWLRRARVGPEPAVSLARSERLIGILILFGIPAGYGLATGLSYLASPVTAAALQVAVGRAVVSAFAALGIVMLVFSAGWHLWFRPSRYHSPSPPPSQSGAAERHRVS